MIAENKLVMDDDSLVDTLVVPHSHSDLMMRMNNLATAIQINKDDLVSQVELISVLRKLGYNREAKIICERALSICPDNADLHVRYAQCLLTLGEYEAGWKENEWRFKLTSADATPKHGQLWDRLIRKGQKLLLITDTSIAETILYARFCNILHDHGMEITVQAPLEWHRFLCAIPGISHCVESADENVEWYFPMGSLPKVFDLKADDMLGIEQYVFPQDDILIPWLKHFSEQSEQLKIGICWRDERGSLNCPLETLEKLFSIPDACFVSLVRHPTVQEKLWLEKHGVKTPLNNQHDWFDMATCAKAMDLVLCVESEGLSALGAMGVPTWSWHQLTPDWMWCMGGKSNAWYPRIRSVRQSRINEWAPLVDASYRTLMQAIHETGLS